MGVAHHLKTIGVISSVTTSYQVKNLHLSFGVSIRNKREFECCRVICWKGLEEL